jgi:TPP-dependent pyruvate/acetoin dehydrogenase alpha subunit
MATRVQDQRQLATDDWRAGLSDDQLRDMLHTLKLARYFDERMEALYRQGRLPGAIYSGSRRASSSVA